MNQDQLNEAKFLFEQGLPGFTHLRYFIISSPFEDNPFYYLQSVEEAEICFLIVNPFALTQSYEFDLPDSVSESLEIKSPSDIVVFNIVNVRGDLASATVNLQAPLVINIVNHKGMQVVLNDPGLNLREPLKNLLQGKVVK
ncbi:flagellar assembly protein FliW [Desulfotomaculum nigrificans]|uniref:flagellar assembly protein FliW n=1 Tax=Desulfotomaculum nigrificans TaxID=1565 RepID=UPI0001FAE6E1|nr:flagellar assembly protein FliW [Desulfotomaculum nigrificans]